MRKLLVKLGQWLQVAADRWSIPAPYRERGCAGRAWRRAFPRASKDRIRLFLACLVRGMWIAPRAMLHFRPDDPIHAVYTSLYCGRVPCGDAMECERFAWFLCDEFGVELDPLAAMWTQHTTLGELFRHVDAPRSY